MDTRQKQSLAVGIVLLFIIILGDVIAGAVSSRAPSPADQSNECVFLPTTPLCDEQPLTPALDSFTNSTLCPKTVSHACSPETIPITSNTGDRIIVIVTGTQLPTYTITDSAGDSFFNFLSVTAASTRLFITNAPITAPSTSVTATFTAVNGAFYGLFEISVSYVSIVSTGVGAVASASGGPATAKTLSITTTTTGSLVLTGVSVPATASCENLPPGITTVNNALLSTLNLNATSTGCATASNGSWTDDELSSSATGAPIGIYQSDFTWPSAANFGTYAFELKPSTARTIQLEYDSEFQTSSTVVSPGPTTIRSAPSSPTITAGIILETEGYIAYTSLSTVQPVTFTLTGTNAVCSSVIVTRGVASAMDFPFAMKCVVLVPAGSYSLTYTATSTDAQTTIFVNSFRLYGLL